MSGGVVANIVSGAHVPEDTVTLLAATPPQWFELAGERWRELLVDHGNCEKKAASNALSLMFTYAEDAALTQRMARLAREELKHFEQVHKHMRDLEVPWMRLAPARYAQRLHRAAGSLEPQRLVDLLLIGALIEARSCERFAGLEARLPAPLSGFYADLARAERRHHELFLELAAQRALPQSIDWRAALRRLGEIEAELVTAPDGEFRFHSGRPA
jgi:tRNA 2-(methylsulfanyl)-N6-isopentenyladenosine37 hydroxylase